MSTSLAPFLSTLSLTVQSNLPRYLHTSCIFLSVFCLYIGLPRMPILSFHGLNPALWPHIGLLSLSVCTPSLFVGSTLYSDRTEVCYLSLCNPSLLLASALHSDRTEICLRLHGVISSLWMSCMSSSVLLLPFCFFIWPLSYSQQAAGNS